MFKYLYSLLLCFVAIVNFAQSGNVEIVKDPRIDALVRKQSTIVPPATSPQMAGYRIQLFFDSDRKAIDEARAKFISMYPKIDTYIIYNAPNYFLKVGDFRTQLDAERVRESILRDFPTSFIVKELINLPRIDID
jgi:hypothetical protein